MKPGIYGLIPGISSITGWVLWAILAVMIPCSLPFVRKSGYFEVRIQVTLINFSGLVSYINNFEFSSCFIGLTFCTYRSGYCQYSILLIFGTGSLFPEHFLLLSISCGLLDVDQEKPASLTQLFYRHASLIQLYANHQIFISIPGTTFTSTSRKLQPSSGILLQSAVLQNFQVKFSYSSYLYRLIESNFVTRTRS